MSIKITAEDFDCLCEAYIGVVCSTHLLCMVKNTSFPTNEWELIPALKETLQGYLHENIMKELGRMEPILARAVYDPKKE